MEMIRNNRIGFCHCLFMYYDMAEYNVYFNGFKFGILKQPKEQKKGLQ